MTTRTSGAGESAPDGSGRASDAGPAVDETPTDGAPRGRPVADETPTAATRVDADRTGDAPASGENGEPAAATGERAEAPASAGDREPAAAAGEPAEAGEPVAASRPPGGSTESGGPAESGERAEAGERAESGERAEAGEPVAAGTEPGEAEEDGEPEEEQRGPLNRDAVRRVVGATTAVIASGDRHGERDVSVLAGPTCFVRVLDGAHLAFPDEGVDPVTALRGNLAEAPGIAMLLVGPGGAGGRRGLHLNGTAEVVPAEALREQHPDLPGDPVPGRATDVWVVVSVGDAYPLDDDAVPPLGAAAASAPGAAGPAAGGAATGDRRSRVLLALVVLLALALLGTAIAAVSTSGPAREAEAPPPAGAPPAGGAPAGAASGAPASGAAAGPTGPPVLFGRVVDIPNPATVVVDVGGTPVTVDVVGIEDGTIPACARPVSQQFARTTLSGRTVTIVPDPTLPPDPDTRAYVVLDTQLSYTDAAIAAGAAPAAGPAQYRSVFDTEQREARSARVGMWGPPCVR